MQIAEQRGVAQDYHSQAMMPRMVTTAEIGVGPFRV
jgi:hypothetical protein